MSFASQHPHQSASQSVGVELKAESNQNPFPLPAERVFRRDNPQYWEHAYQYGYSSYEQDCQPALVAYPTSKDEILQIVLWAQSEKVAIAVRTGGHQYSAASSTTGNNILVDMTQGFHEIEWDEVSGCVRFGVNIALEELLKYFQTKEVFLPTGQCSHVHLGGHFQTGGYGQLARSHGLLGDYVERFEIITGKGEVLSVDKKSNSALYYAVLGGSPGNMGIVTHVTLRPLRDGDHTNSRGIKCLILYTKDTLKKWLDLLAKFSDRGDVPGDFDFCVTMTSWGMAKWMFSGVDEEMEKKHPGLYGHDSMAAWPNAIVIYAQWANLLGAHQVYDSNEMKEVKNLLHESLFKIYELTDDHPTPMSKLAQSWMFTNVREFASPYVRRTYMSNRTNLSENVVGKTWSSWVSDRMECLRSEANGCHLNCQFQFWGGKYSAFKNKASDLTAYSWRESLTIGYSLDVFYDTSNPFYGSDAPRRTAEEWQAQNDKESIGKGKIFCDADRRVLWGSFGDKNMDDVWQCYYETQEKYDRLKKIRKENDPSGVFVPNRFCVGAADSASFVTRPSPVSVPCPPRSLLSDAELSSRLWDRRSELLRSRNLPFNVDELKSQQLRRQHDEMKRRTTLLAAAHAILTSENSKSVQPQPIPSVAVSHTVSPSLNLKVADVDLQMNKLRRIIGSDKLTFQFRNDGPVGESTISWHSAKRGRMVKYFLTRAYYTKSKKIIHLYNMDNGDRIITVAGDNLKQFEQQLADRKVPNNTPLSAM